MPQVSDVFGPIFQPVVLDGSGNGTVTFQAVGNNIRLSNIFFKVQSVTKQAVCTIYKGQVADGNIIFNSNSGSTGGNAKGNVDLFDGETVFVRWTGGDAGAIATATFTGGIIPFGEKVGTSQLNFDDPIAAGDGSLIFPAIKSPNYAAGVSGWSIARDGTAEFNNATVRGSLSAGGGTVVVDATGVNVIGPVALWRINATGGFIAKNIPDDGAFASMTMSGNGTSNGGATFYRPTSPSTVNGVPFNAGYIGAFYNTVGAVDDPYIAIVSPFVTTGPLQTAQIQLYGQDSGSAVDNSRVNLDASSVTVNNVDFRKFQPLIRLIQQAAQAMTNGINTSIVFGAGSEDMVLGATGWHSTTVNNTRITPSIAGTYDVRGCFSMPNTGGPNYSQLVAAISVTGTRVDPSNILRPDLTPAATSALTQAYVHCNGTTDYIELIGNQQNSTSSVQNTNTSSPFRSTLEARLIYPD